MRESWRESGQNGSFSVCPCVYHWNAYQSLAESNQFQTLLGDISICFCSAHLHWINGTNPIGVPLHTFAVATQINKNNNDARIEHAGHHHYLALSFALHVTLLARNTKQLHSNLLLLTRSTFWEKKSVKFWSRFAPGERETRKQRAKSRSAWCFGANQNWNRNWTWKEIWPFLLVVQVWDLVS